MRCNSMNYWEPAGPWDYRADGRTTKHWVGVTPTQWRVVCLFTFTSRHTIYRGRSHLKNLRYSGFRGLFGVCCLRLQRLGSSVGFGTGTREAPNKSIHMSVHFPK